MYHRPRDPHRKVVRSRGIDLQGFNGDSIKFPYTDPAIIEAWKLRNWGVKYLSYQKADIWSCGTVLFKMLTGYIPWNDRDDWTRFRSQYDYIQQRPLTFPEYITPHAQDFLRDMLLRFPRSRSNICEVAKHSWLAEYFNMLSAVQNMPIPECRKKFLMLGTNDSSAE
ncbi:hypothetical protein BU23DRAFT_97872 [Bimuria novae-zelandiae CBS 107.79]|uniref:non-specific serine/threonine protein kinase n=1 Tax=Bimuria novae-zelandiae CBS 107.79 TaxID=1447943 RepID=A0A6A5VUQ9_9PLEO|nr:hypothetical protein BU23DRAFT_97872 [Bimuria novae-zelandiae CBS 107.79]